MPKVDAHSALARYQKLHGAMGRSLIASAHDLSDGGLAVALAEKAFAGNLGLSVDLGAVRTEGELTDTETLYSESQSRILVTVSPGHAPEIEAIFGDDASRIGTVISERTLLVASKRGGTLIERDLAQLKKAWKASLDL